MKRGGMSTYGKNNYPMPWVDTRVNMRIIPSSLQAVLRQWEERRHLGSDGWRMGKDIESYFRAIEAHMVPRTHWTKHLAPILTPEVTEGYVSTDPMEQDYDMTCSRRPCMHITGSTRITIELEWMQ